MQDGASTAACVAVVWNGQQKLERGSFGTSVDKMFGSRREHKGISVEKTTNTLKVNVNCSVTSLTVGELHASTIVHEIGICVVTSAS